MTVFGIDNYPGFVSAILLFQLAPGPGTLAILNSTARGGRAAGMGAVFGTLAGDLVFMLLAVSGLAALSSSCPVAFQLLRWAGIVYLCRFGWNLLRSAGGGLHGETPPTGSDCHFRRAFLVGLTNPKAIMFFMAFFPLFMTAASGPLTLALMMAHVSLLCLVYQTVLVFVGDQLARRLCRVPVVRVVAARLAGASVIGFGVRLAFADR